MEILTSLIPTKQTFSESYRLDLLMDDYLQQAHLFNHHPDVFLYGKYSKIPTFLCHKLLYIPHRVRLDLTALMTSAILFPMPNSLFRETMEQLLIPYLTQEEIHDLIALPNFMKTAIVSLSRRICVKEIQELSLNGFLSPKPSFPSSSTENSTLKALELFSTSSPASPPVASFPPRDSNGFRYLSFLRNYLSQPIQRISRPHDPASSGLAPENNSQFTEMELDLLKYLPDLPTLASCPHPSSAAYRDWVSLAARHAVILMSRSSNCPSLTKPQRSTTHEIVLKQLKPLLVAAEMTYDDLEITTTGPSIDGRTTKKSNVLSFGAGVPDGRASSLTWNAYGPVRDYQRPWIPSKQEEQAVEDPQGITSSTVLV